MRIYLVNVGSNSSHRAFSPIFDDGTFEFLPIPVSDWDGQDWPGATRYRDLRSYRDAGRYLLQFVSPKLHDWPCHNDPEFGTFTYGNSSDNPSSMALTEMREGDVLLFLARLKSWADGKRTGGAGFYLIGGLLADYAGWVTPQSPRANRFANNANAIRGDEKFWGIAGAGQSRRFERAVPVVKEICDQVFRDRRGQPWNWNNGQSELTRINSYTRTCRCVLDASSPEQGRRAATLRDWIARHTGDYDAELLAAVP